MNTGLTKLPVRLMMRVEGEWWNAYIGPAVSRTGEKTLLGSIRLSIAMLNPKMKQAFLDLMSDAMAHFIEDLTGTLPVMEIGPAPESERSGRA